MAKRRKPRPAGPPPAKSPKMQRLASGTEPVKARRRAPGEPKPPSWRTAVGRALIFGALYYLLVVWLTPDTSPQQAALLAVAAFAIMIPVGMLMDRLRYRTQMKRWRARNGIPEPVKEPKGRAADTAASEAEVDADATSETADPAPAAEETTPERR